MRAYALDSSVAPAFIVARCLSFLTSRRSTVFVTLYSLHESNTSLLVTPFPTLALDDESDFEEEEDESEYDEEEEEEAEGQSWEELEREAQASDR